MADLIPMLAAAAGATAAGGYQISRSLRFNSADSAYLSRTPASASNRKTWTWSGWVKRSQLSSSTIFAFFGACDATNSNANWLGFVNDSLAFVVGDGASGNVITSAVYRDTSAWQHIVFVYDSGQATSSNRQKIYVNSVLVTSFSVSTYVTQNLDGFINNNVEHNLGARVRPSGTSLSYFDGYLADIHFVDGQALTPSDFGETDATTGVWIPKAYAGTYGTNGFYLDFSDNTSTTTIGYDAAGSNDWTANNFSVAAGAGNDSLVDTPTPYGTDTGAGGQVRGNYCTLNPLDTSVFAGSLALSNGNLQVAGTNESAGVKSTFFISSGKWYWEGTLTSGSTGSLIGIGQSSSIYYPGYSSTSYAYQDDGNKLNNDSGSAYGATYTTNDVIGIALDLDTGTLVFYKNGSTQGTAYSSLSGNFTPHFGAAGGGNSSTWVANFGQRPFAHAAPSGFKALCTTNLPDPTVVQGDDYFNTVIWTGTDVSAGRSITGVGFAPDFVWSKPRSLAYQHNLYDAVRGVGERLQSNATDAESTNVASGYISSFDSDGFTTTAGATNNENFNDTGDTYVAWNWNAGGSNATNTDGTITSTVRANTTAGFSIATYTGTGTSTGDSFGHGLGVQPKMVIIKNRTTAATGWNVLFPDFMTSGQYMALNQTIAISSSANSGWGGSLPDSTKVYVGGSSWTNTSGNNYLAYCFASIDGFSAIGSYTGNGSADGPFVYTGFRPAFVLIKRSNSTGNWTIIDTKREGYNVDNDPLYPNLSNAEGTTDLADILSNGFKLRSTDSSVNASGSTYIFMAFAENPFKYALAR